MVADDIRQQEEQYNMNTIDSNDSLLTIPAVSRKILETRGPIDPGAERLLAAEADYICKRRKAINPDNPGISSEGKPENMVGLALSGGGIRSATFSLGIMQALSHKGLLDKVDYLSTVSGGGYIGSALTWFTSDIPKLANTGGDVKFSTADQSFPFGTDDPAPDSVQTDNSVQQHILRYLRQHGSYLSPGAGISLFSLLGVVFRGMLLNLVVWLPIFAFFFYLVLKIDPTIFEKLRSLGFLIIALLVISVGFYSLSTWLRRIVQKDRLWYDLRRRVEKAAALLIPAAIFLIIIGYLPVVYEIISVKVEEMKGAGVISMITGIGVAINSFLTSASTKKPSQIGIKVPLASALFLYGALLVAYQIAADVYPNYLVLSVVMALVLGFFVNLNYISIHRYYRDRLMETFMPDPDTALENKTTAAVTADSAKMSEFAGKGDEARGPYHIINTNIVLVNSKNPTYSIRGGDNFIISPYYCGSNATGWYPTDEYMGGSMTLATAVAISGAAANPNSGVGGEGITRNKFLSLGMSLLNLKLGYWAANPHEKYHTNIPANHFIPGAYSLGNALGILGFREDRKFVQLSDGGHYENTGVYELIRRRMKLIIVCDGGADPDTSFSDFQITVRRVEDDFGARVKVDDELSPDKVVPITYKESTYPKDRKFATQGYMRGTVTYADGSKGTIIYLKTTLIRDVSFKVKGYAASNADFPDESTADQFFDEVQFEAYRELGYAIASQMHEEQKTVIDEILSEPSRA